MQIVNVFLFLKYDVEFKHDINLLWINKKNLKNGNYNS